MTSRAVGGGAEDGGAEDGAAEGGGAEGGGAEGGGAEDSCPPADGTAADLRRASIMIDMHRYRDAAQLLATVLASQPDNARAWCLLARTHLGRGNFAAAVQAAARASALDPADDWPYRLASTALIGLGKTGDAVTAALEARRLAPLQWRPHICLAQAAAADGQLELARMAAAEALAIAPDEADVHVTAGKVALKRGELELAQQRQEAALALDPGHIGAVNELGRISMRSRDVAGAVGHFLRAARSAPGSPVFGHNSELAIRQVGVRIAAALAAALSAAFCLVVLALVGRPDLAVRLAPPLLVAAGWAITELWRLPPDGRRHLFRLIRAWPSIPKPSILRRERSRSPASPTRASRP
ncbi:MAG: tetratricopeptide repeat protein [Streptosporangiaceae bacterium]